MLHFLWVLPILQYRISFSEVFPVEGQVQLKFFEWSHKRLVLEFVMVVVGRFV